MAGIPPKAPLAGPRAVQAWMSYHRARARGSEVLSAWVLYENPATAGRASPVLSADGRPLPRLWFTHPEVGPVVVFHPQRYELVVGDGAPRRFTRQNYLMILLAAVIEARELDDLSTAAEHAEYARLAYAE